VKGSKTAGYDPKTNASTSQHRNGAMQVLVYEQH